MGDDALLKLPAELSDQGYTVRSATFADLEIVTSLLATHNLHIRGEKNNSSRETALYWSVPGFDLPTSSRLVMNGVGRLVGYALLEDFSNPPVRNWADAVVHPDFYGRGIGDYLTDWLKLRGRRALERVEKGSRVVMEAMITSGHQPSIERLQRAGFTYSRTYHRMHADLDSRPVATALPDGVEIRTYRGEEELWQVMVAAMDGFKDHFGFVDPELQTEFRFWKHWTETDPKFDPTLWFLAVAGDKIAGISLCQEAADHDPAIGWVEDLAVDPAWRRKGLGLALLTRSFQEFYDRGQRAAGLTVDAESLTGATRLYRRAGMLHERSFEDYEYELQPGKELATITLDG